MAIGDTLIGRGSEIRRISSTLDHDGAAGIVLVGDAGVGKSRLATACASLGGQRGFVPTRVAASRAAATVPLGALAPLLPFGRVTAARGVTALSQTKAAFAELAGGSRLMLIVDDAHVLDDASAVLLEQLAASGDVFLVVTVRSGMTAPDSVTALWKDHGFDRLTVSTFDRRTSDEFVKALVGDELDRSILSALWSQTAGNALFLTELIRGAQDSGTLIRRDGRWHQVGPFSPSVRLVEVVAARLGALSPDESTALEIVAFGEPLNEAMLEALIDHSIVENLERKGLIGAEPTRRVGGAVGIDVRLAHPMYGEVVRASTPPVRITAISTQLADALDATDVDGSDSLRASLWRLDGGGVPDVDVLAAGTATARFAHSHAVAQRLARLLYDRAPSFESGMLLADILYEGNRPADCDPVFAALEPLAVTDEQIAGLAMARATMLFWKLSQADEAFGILQTAIDRLGAGRERDEVDACLAVLEVQVGRAPEVLQRMAPTVLNGEGRPYVLAALSVSFAWTIVGRCGDVIDLADAAFAARVGLGDELTMFQSGVLMINKAVALNEAGRVDEALALADLIREMAAGANDLSSQGFSCIALARICIVAGRLGDAVRWAAEAVDLLRRWGSPGPLRWALGYVALASAMRGDVLAATAAIADLDAMPVHPANLLEVDILRGRAWTVIASGDLAEGLAMLHQFAATMNEGGLVSFEAAVLFDLVRLGETSAAVTDRLIEIGMIGQSRLHTAMSEAAIALTADDPVGIGAQALVFEELGCRLFAAEMAAAAANSRCRRGGDLKLQTEWTLRAATFAARLDGARTPGLAIDHVPVRLTRREHEVADLAAQGMTSKTIGETLFISDRTVENHLANVYTKLGVVNRAELAETMTGYLN